MIKPVFEILKNARVLSDLFEIYYQNTGMVVSVHRPQTAERISFYPRGERSTFCKLIQTTPEGLARCEESDRKGLAFARRKGSSHIYHCHAGLVDIIIPLDYKGVDVGCLMSGQVLLEQPALKDASALFKRVESLGSTSFDAFARALATVKVVEKSRLHFCVKLLDLFANYIVKAENELQLQMAIATKDRMLHRRELEKVHLEKTLKDLSISVLSDGTGSRSPSARDEPYGQHRNHVVEKACAFIAENFNKDIVLEDVAQAVFLSPNYLSSLFRKTVGCTFRAFLVRERIRAAKALLVSTDVPIKEIVERTGFKDYNYFNRTFRCLAGIPPARYRSNGNGRQEGVDDKS
jgi:AraC-like DNA-binding protein/ligand-binding sensor protein